MKTKYYEALEQGLDKDAEQVAGNAGDGPKSPTLSQTAADALGRGATLKDIVHAYIGGHVENAAGFAGGLVAVAQLGVPAQEAATESPRRRSHKAE